MILQIYAFKNNKLRCFTQPFYNDVPEENLAAGTTRAIIDAPEEKRGIYKNKCLYRLGEFDDTKGKITSCDPVLVLDCDEVIASIDYGKEDFKN